MATRKEFLKTMATGAAVVSLPSYFKKISRLTPEDYRPNILWITMEDTCPQFIGCYGNKQALTPNMDRLASSGVIFENAFSTAPVCAPSRSTIITGCLPEMMGTGHHRSRYPVPEFIKGFPYYLRKAGYFTSNNRKTDYNIGNKHFIKEAWDESFGEGGWGTMPGPSTGTFDESSQEAGWWHRKPGQPFFSVFNLTDSHQSRTMVHPYRWYEEYVLKRIPKEKRISPEDITVPPFYRDTPEMRKQMSRVYNSLQYTDYEFGEILDHFKKDGLEDDTIIFCFADHGEGIPRGKTSAVGLGFQVPFFIYFPPQLRHLSPWPIGKVTQELVSSAEDTAPTVLSLAGIAIPKYMTGRPLLGKQRRPPRPFVFSGRNRIDESPELSRCVTDGRYFYTRVFMPQLPLVKITKYQEVSDFMRTIRSDYQAGLLDPVQESLVSPKQPVEYLYDLKEDVWQVNNLAENPFYQTQLNSMRSVLQKHLLDTRDIMFMPEYEMARIAKQQTPYEFRMNEQKYPFERILKAANLVGGEETTEQQFKLLKDPDSTVRYWAAIGLDASGNEVMPYKKEIMDGLQDSHPSVQIVMAGIAYKLYKSSKAREVLQKFITEDREENVLSRLQALQTVEYMREQGRAFITDLHEVLEKSSGYKNNQSITEVDLHFLEGRPLYFKKFAKWNPESHMKRDRAIHFVG